MSGLIEWLNAYYDRAEQRTLAAESDDPGPWRADTDDRTPVWRPEATGSGLVMNANGVELWDCEGSPNLCMTRATAGHVAAHDPQWRLADIARKRKILTEHAPDQHGYCPTCCDNTVESPCHTVRLLAEEFSSEPGYDERWRP